MNTHQDTECDKTVIQSQTSVKQQPCCCQGFVRVAVVYAHIKRCNTSVSGSVRGQASALALDLQAKI